MDFITLEDELFCLRQAGRDSISYYGKFFVKRNKKKNFKILALNRPQMLDVDMDQIIGTIVDSLFSVCVTLGKKSII